MEKRIESLILVFDTAGVKNSKSEPKRDSLWQKTQFANLIRYAPSGTYYARVRVKGKLIKRSLETTSITVAKMKLGDMVKEEREKAERLGGRATEKLTFGDVLALYRQNGFRPLIPKKKKDMVRLKPKSARLLRGTRKGAAKVLAGTGPRKAAPREHHSRCPVRWGFALNIGQAEFARGALPSNA